MIRLTMQPKTSMILCEKYIAQQIVSPGMLLAAEEIEKVNPSIYLFGVFVKDNIWYFLFPGISLDSEGSVYTIPYDPVHAWYGEIGKFMFWNGFLIAPEIRENGKLPTEKDRIVELLQCIQDLCRFDERKHIYKEACKHCAYEGDADVCDECIRKGRENCFELAPDFVDKYLPGYRRVEND